MVAGCAPRSFLAMGCRERTPRRLNIPVRSAAFTPPAVRSAGQYGRLYPGSRVVIWVRRIGLIMAPYDWDGAKVEMVCE